MNAIVEIAGKQFSIEKDAQLKVPKLSEERREELAKIASTQGEQSKIAISAL